MRFLKCTISVLHCITLISISHYSEKCILQITYVVEKENERLLIVSAKLFPQTRRSYIR